MKLEAWMAVGPDYAAAHSGVAVISRGERRFLRVAGKAPGEMLKGILSGSIPGEARAWSGAGVTEEAGSERGIPENTAGSPGGVVFSGRGSYSALLTPKGRMVSDLRVLRGGDGSFLLDFPPAGMEGAREHLRKHLPPRLAQVEDVSHHQGLLTLVGPGGSEVVAREVLGGYPSKEALFALEEGEFLLRGRTVSAGVAVIRNGDFRPPALDLLLPIRRREEVVARLVSAGARPLGRGTWETLQVEGGRPVFGEDMDEDTIPLEAGIQERAIDQRKGCYTGQEVIVRIRDRGQVNKRLVGILLGAAPLPGRGTELFLHGREKTVGWVTRAVFSPAFGQGAGFAYLRREVGEGEEVRLGGTDGPPARVVALGDAGWTLSPAGSPFPEAAPSASPTGP